MIVRQAYLPKPKFEELAAQLLELLDDLKSGPSGLRPGAMPLYTKAMQINT